LTAPGGTFLNGLATDDNNATSPLSLPGSRYTEFEFGMRLVLLGVNDNDTLDFRVRLNGAVLNTYTITPRIIVYVDDAIGAAQGDAVAVAVGSARRSGVGAASGDSTALGHINIAKPAVGAASGDSTAVGHITGFSLGRGVAQGDSTAIATGTNGIPKPMVGIAQGDSVALARGISASIAKGIAVGDAVAVAIPHAASIGFAIGGSEARGVAPYPPRHTRVWHMQSRIGQKKPRARTEITQ
jgi:hypothetical protein